MSFIQLNGVCGIVEGLMKMVRLPDDLYEQLVKEAEAAYLSAAKYIELLLRKRP